jgi:hypothetical protein
MSYERALGVSKTGCPPPHVGGYVSESAVSAPVCVLSFQFKVVGLELGNDSTRRSFQTGAYPAMPSGMIRLCSLMFACVRICSLTGKSSRACFANRPIRQRRGRGANGPGTDVSGRVGGGPAQEKIFCQTNPIFRDAATGVSHPNAALFAFICAYLRLFFSTGRGICRTLRGLTFVRFGLLEIFHAYGVANFAKVIQPERRAGL